MSSISDKSTLRLTEKQRAFTVAYYTPGSKTFGNGVESARIAGYAGNDNVLTQIGHKLVRNGKVTAHKEQITVDSKLNHEFISTQLTTIIATGQNVDKLRSLDMIGKHINYYDADNKSKADQPTDLTPDEIEELKAHSARLRLIRMAKESLKHG